MPVAHLDGLDVHHLEWGSGDTAVLIHTGPGEAGDWGRVASRLAGDLRCVAVDLYGRNGTTSWTDVRGPTMDDVAGLVQRFVARIGGPVHLVGHSYGGAVALRLAITSPDSVRRLVVIEPQVLGLLREAGDRTAGVGDAVMINFKNLVAAGHAEPAWRMMIDTYSGDGFWDRLPATTRSRFLERTDEAFRWVDPLLLNPTTLAQLAQLSQPTLVVQGTATTEPERRMSEITADAIPQARLVLVDGAGHMSVMTHPDEVADVIRDELRGEHGASA